MIVRRNLYPQVPRLRLSYPSIHFTVGESGGVVRKFMQEDSGRVPEVPTSGSHTKLFCITNDSFAF